MTENQNDATPQPLENAVVDESQAPEPVPASPELSEVPEPVPAGVDLTNHDEEDVKAALERETQDGSGLENDDPKALPAGDFDSFATDDVEVEE